MGCCCSIKNPGNTSIGRVVDCPKCGRVFPASTTNFNFNEHLDNCLLSSNNQVHPYVGITYWEKVQLDGEYKWILKTYDPNMIINEKEIHKESFGSKQVWVRGRLEKFRIPWQNGCQIIQIQQANILESSLAAISQLRTRFLHGEIKIKFEEDTIVQDAGGLLREWSTQVILTMVKLGFLIKTDTVEIMYRLNPNVQTDLNKRQVFHFLGQLIAKCLFERIPISCYLDRTLIRQMIGQKVTLSDMELYDKDLYHAWKFILKQDVESLQLNFTIDQNGKNHSLKTNGNEMEVTQENVKEYVDLCIQFYSQKSIEPYISDFLNGFHLIIPKSVISVFNAEEFEMFLFGLPFLDLDDWINNSIYKGCDRYDVHICWFWDILKQWNQDQLKQFLRFCTGSTRVPVEGFAKLESNRGEVSLFCIEQSIFDQNNPYPRAHTCFNRIDLPKYQNKQQMEMFLLATLDESLNGQFGLE
ncbi:hypothetical protein pb186bvf_019329 [Paramecium bursaria]